MDIRKQIAERIAAPELADKSLELLKRQRENRRVTEELEAKELELAEAGEQYVELQGRIEDLEGSARVFDEMIRFRPVLTLGVLEQLAELTEVDPQYIDLIRRLMQAEGLTFEPSENDRLLAVYEARVLAANDPVTERILTIWTDYGFGLKIEIEPVDEKAREAWTEFWTALRNQPVLSERVIHELSQSVLVDGEIYFVAFTSEDDGQVTLRVVLTDEIKEIVREKDDVVVPIYYKRVWKDSEGNVQPMYYRDWRIPDDSDLLDDVKLDSEIPIAGVDGDHDSVLMIHVAHRQRGVRSLRGWPLLTTGAPWARAYKEFLENRAAVARAVAAVVDKLIVKGGSKALDVMRSRFTAALDSLGRYGLTDVPEPGSTWLENEALTRTRMPLSTAAGDAQIDGGALLAQAGLPGGIPPHLLGRGEVVRMAVAEKMDDPIYRQFTRYQNFWSSVWNDVGNLVLSMQEKYQDAKYETKEVRVTTDALVNVALTDLVAVGDAVLAMVMAGLVSAETAQAVATEILRMALHVLGVQDAGEILEPKEKEEEVKELKEVCSSCRHLGLLKYGNLTVCTECGKKMQY